MIKTLFDLFHPKCQAKYVFIPTMLINGRKFIMGNAVGFFQSRPPIIDHIHLLSNHGLTLKIQFPNRAEALEFKKTQSERTETVAQNNPKGIDHKFNNERDVIDSQRELTKKNDIEKEDANKIKLSKQEVLQCPTQSTNPKTSCSKTERAPPNPKNHKKTKNSPSLNQ
jgi:hypothetical protein